MSILTNVAVPVISLSPQRRNGKVQQEHPGTGSFHGGGPLLVKPSTHAPRQARIVHRVAEHGVPLYLLQIGDVIVPDVGLDEILDYVSPRELEEFENRQFEEENEILRVAETVREVEREAAREHAKERAKRKGVLIHDELDDESSTSEADNPDAPLGRHGRARPSYTHLYKMPQRRRRRKRDPVTGELLPLSDREIDLATDGASSLDEAPERSVYPSQVSLTPEHPKRRRRKRDKVTGELLPLSPEVKARSKEPPFTEQPYSSSDHYKRSRRRRHPITRELMPLGWRYDPEAETKAAERPRFHADVSVLPQDRDEAIKDGPDIKRLKVASDAMESSSTESCLTAPRDQDDSGRVHPGNNARTGQQPKNRILGEHIDLGHESSDDSEKERPEGLLQRFIARPKVETLTSAVKTTSLAVTPPSMTPPKQLTLASFLANNSKANRSLSASSTTSNSIQEVQMVPKPNPSRQLASTVPANPAIVAQQKTSIVNPMASVNAVVIGLDDDPEVLGNDEWYIEAILDHRLSDPRTHPPDLGHRPVMLYRTKWQGFKEPTWEPAESFIDSEVLEDYRKKAGLNTEKGSTNNGHGSKMKQARASGSGIALDQQKNVNGSNGQTSEDDEDEDGEEQDYEIEAILTHHLSDPATHSKGLGKDPVMLYLVKWVGFEKPTWEPIDSFPDRGIIKEYEAHGADLKSMRRR